MNDISVILNHKNFPAKSERISSLVIKSRFDGAKEISQTLLFCSKIIIKMFKFRVSPPPKKRVINMYSR